MTRSWTNSYAGVTLGKNELGMTCLILGLGSLWRFLIAYRDRGRPCRSRRLITHGALLAIVLWLFLMANSMTSLSCFILAGTVMTLASRPSLARSSSAVHLLVVAAVGISLFALFADRNMVTLVGRNPTLTGRTEIWDGVLSVPHNPVMGAGYESFFLGPRLDEFWSMPGCNGLQEAHNGYLEVYLNLGWIGVSLFAMVMANGYRKVIAAFRAKPEVSSLNVAYFVAAVIYSFTEAGFRMMSPIWTFFLWAIVAASQATSQEGLSVVAIDSTTDVAESESTLYDGLGVAFLRGPDESV
ncbi:MAG: O-antigen ligase family protein [Terriglobia bacterium]